MTNFANVLILKTKIMTHDYFFVCAIDAHGDPYYVPFLVQQQTETEAQSRELYAKTLDFLRNEPHIHEYDYNRQDHTTLADAIGYDPSDYEVYTHTVSVYLIQKDSNDLSAVLDSHDFFSTNY